MLLFFSWKKYLWFKSEERAVKRGVSPPLPINYFFKKNWFENNTYTLELLKIALPSIGSTFFWTGW